MLFFAGGFSVCIFFVLSGFVLSNSFFKRKTHSVLVSSSVRRYFRLMIPALGSILLAYVVLRAGAMPVQQTAQLTESFRWLGGSHWQFIPSLPEALYQGLYGVFFTGFVSYNPVLWTMQLELYGSFIVFMFLALFGKLQRRWIFYILLALITMKTYYLAFVLGMVLCDIWVNHPELIERVRKPILAGLLGVALVIGSWRYGSIYPHYYDSLQVPLFTTPEFITFANILAALVVVFAVLRLNLVSRFFETKPLQFLGKISFSLYLTHFIVMGSFASILFNMLMPRYGYGTSILLMALPTICVTFLIAILYTRYVDQPSIRWSKNIGNWLMGPGKNPQEPGPSTITAIDLQPLARKPVVETE
jgi:peptidoglycan/LPS O-acetylase OafA/YrhL